MFFPTPHNLKPLGVPINAARAIALLSSSLPLLRLDQISSGSPLPSLPEFLPVSARCRPFSSFVFRLLSSR